MTEYIYIYIYIYMYTTVEAAIVWLLSETWPEYKLEVGIWGFQWFWAYFYAVLDFITWTDSFGDLAWTLKPT